jgi:hypothetical protein
MGSAPKSAKSKSQRGQKEATAGHLAVRYHSVHVLRRTASTSERFDKAARNGTLLQKRRDKLQGFLPKAGLPLG